MDECWHSMRSSYKRITSDPQPFLKHTTTLVDDSLITVGGINHENKLVSSVHLLNVLSTNKMARNQWQERAVAGNGPPPLHSHAAAPDRSNLYIFGGKTETGVLNDLYTLDCGNFHWRKPRLTGSLPAARYLHTMNTFAAMSSMSATATFAGSNSNIVIFGGLDMDDTPLDDLNVLDIASRTWSTKDSDDGPPPLFGHSACVVMNTKLYVFGGNSGKTLHNDLFILDLETFNWEKAETSGALPPPQYRHTATIIGHRFMLVLGGFAEGGAPVESIHYLDTETFEWTELPSNLAGSKASRVCVEGVSADNAEGLIYMVGGEDPTEHTVGVFVFEAAYAMHTLKLISKAPKRFRPPTGATSAAASQRLDSEGTSGVSDLAAIRKKLQPVSSPASTARGQDSPSSVREHSPSTTSSSKALGTSQPLHKTDSSTDSSAALEEAQAELRSLSTFLMGLYGMILKHQNSNIQGEEGWKKCYNELSSFVTITYEAHMGLSPSDSSSDRKAEKDSSSGSASARSVTPATSIPDASAMRVVDLGDDEKKHRKKKMSSHHKKKPARPMSHALNAEEKSGLFSKLGRFFDKQADDAPLEFTRQDGQSGSFTTTSFDNNNNAAEAVAKPAEKELSPEEKMEKTRLSVLAELHSTEKDYVNDLNVMVKVYVKPMCILGDDIQAQDKMTLFSNVEMILPVNEEMLKSLEDIMHKPPADQRVGAIFLKMSDYLRMYSQYCGNYPHATRLLGTIKKRPNVNKFLAEMKKSSLSRNLDLENYMIKPMQRICRYPLLLRELLKHTPKTHPDYNDLQKCFEKIEEIVREVNEKKRIMENQAIIVEIQNKMTEEDLSKFKLVTPTRSFIMEGKVKEVTVKKGGSKTSRRSVYLFNDAVFIASTSNVTSNVFGKKMTPKALILLNKLALESVNDSVFQGMTDPLSKVKASFCVVNKADKKKYVLVTSSEEEKENWVSQIKQMQSKTPTSKIEEEDTSARAETPFHITVNENNMAGLKDALADTPQLINRKDKAGWTPLILAASKANFGAIELLTREEECDVSCSNDDGNTALHYFVRATPPPGSVNKYIVLMDTLMSKGCKVNVKNKLGETPLHQAVVKGNAAAVDYLLNHDADPDEKNSLGESVYDLGLRMGTAEVKDLLAKAKAKKK